MTGNPSTTLLHQTLGDKRLRDSRYRLLIPGGLRPSMEILPFTRRRTILAISSMVTSPCTRSPLPHLRLLPISSRSSRTATSCSTEVSGPTNPTMMGLVEALTCFTVQREQISILSIGVRPERFPDQRQADRRSRTVSVAGNHLRCHALPVPYCHKSGRPTSRERQGYALGPA